jgi:mannopine transport system permease protein
MHESWRFRFVRLLAAVLIGLILAFLVLPTLIVFPVSFSNTEYLVFPPQGFTLRWYGEYLSDSAWREATLFSLKIACLATVVSLTIGTLAALAVSRGNLPAKGVISTLILAPMIVPNITVALAIYLQFATWRLSGTTFGFVLAHSVLAVPFVFILVSAGLQRLDYLVEMAALSMGASRARTIREVTLPLAMPSIGAAGIFAFLTSFDETVVSFFISNVETKTLTRKIFEDIDFNLSPIIAAVSSLIVITTLALMALPRLATRGKKKASAA